MLDRDEYVEQAYLFELLHERMGADFPLQDLLQQARHELLATTKLPMAVDFLLAELKHFGEMSRGMKRLAHYFSPFQSFLVEEAEKDRGRFDMKTAFRILQAEAKYRSESASRQGYFVFQFEALCRNRLHYDRGLAAISEDPAYDSDWKEWVLVVRRQLGLVDLADLIYGRSEEYLATRRRKLGAQTPPEAPILFGLQEGKIAWANRHKDPLLLFAALQRHLHYPAVPRLEPVDTTEQIVPQLQRRMERLEMRIKLLEEEGKQGIDITKFYGALPQRGDSPPNAFGPP
jgi:hypothetical protein